MTNNTTRKRLDRTTLLLGSNNMKISCFIDWIEISCVSWTSELTKKAGNQHLNITSIEICWQTILIEGAQVCETKAQALNVESQERKHRGYNYWDTPNVRGSLIFPFFTYTLVVLKLSRRYSIYSNCYPNLSLLCCMRWTVLWCYNFYGYDDRSCIMHNIMLTGWIDSNDLLIKFQAVA